MAETPITDSLAPFVETFPLSWIGDILISVRKQRGLTQEQLAQKVGSHQAAIARLEDSKYQNSAIKTISTTLDALGADIQLFVTLRDNIRNL
jgi:transcriptional regulator with XRE-family HTH domain